MMELPIICLFHLARNLKQCVSDYVFVALCFPVESLVPKQIFFRRTRLETLQQDLLKDVFFAHFLSLFWGLWISIVLVYVGGWVGGKGVSELGHSFSKYKVTSQKCTHMLSIPKSMEDSLRFN